MPRLPDDIFVSLPVAPTWKVADVGNALARLHGAQVARDAVRPVPEVRLAFPVTGQDAFDAWDDFAMSLDVRTEPYPARGEVALPIPNAGRWCLACGLGWVGGGGCPRCGGVGR